MKKILAIPFFTFCFSFGAMAQDYHYKTSCTLSAKSESAGVICPASIEMKLKNESLSDATMLTLNGNPYVYHVSVTEPYDDTTMNETVAATGSSGRNFFYCINYIDTKHNSGSIKLWIADQQEKVVSGKNACEYWCKFPVSKIQ
jgi:hypothetical protein